MEKVTSSWAERLPRVLLLVGLGLVVSAASDRQARKLQEAIHLMETRGNYGEALRLFREASEGPDRALAAQALFYSGRCYEKLDEPKAASAYQQVLDRYPEQGDLAYRARERLRAVRRERRMNFLLEPMARRIANPHLDGYFSSPSPDGTFFSTVDWESGDLALYDSLTQTKRRLTDKGGMPQSGELAQHSLVSPDGTRVAYVWFSAQKSDVLYELWITRIDGSEPRRLFRGTNGMLVRPDAWSSDGKKLLVLLGGPNEGSEIVLMSVDHGSTRRIKELTEPMPLETSLSPDGRYVVYDHPAEAGSEQSDIFLVSIDGGQEERLVSHPANDLWPSWTPDGQRVLFYSNRTGLFGLWLLTVVSGRPEGDPILVRKEMGPASPIGFTRNGSYYYALVTGTSDVYLATVDPSAGAVLEAPRRLDAGFSGANLTPTWSPDGRCLAHLSMRRELYVLEPSHRLAVSCFEGKELRLKRELSPRMSYMRSLSWSPDGRSILVMGSDRAQRWGIYLVDSTTGDVEPVVQDEPGTSTVFAPRWTHDRRAILYKKLQPPRLLRRDLLTGEETEIYRVSEPNALPDYGLSGDGQWLAVMVWEAEAGAMSVRILPLGGGAEREIYRGPSAGTPHFTPDGKEVWFVQGPNDLNQERELWRVRLADGIARPLGIRMEGLRDVSLHPDGRRLAFISGSLASRTEVWVLENLLPPIESRR